jgi:hypothetical protein
MKRTTIAVIVFVVALVAVPTVVAFAQSDQPDSTAPACPYNGEGGMDHLAMHNQMSAMMGHLDMGQMSAMMGQMDMGQMSAMMGQMDMEQMAGMRPDAAR